MTRRLLTISILICGACSADPLPPGHYVIITGQETDTFSLSPAPTKYTVSSLSETDSNASLTVVSTADKPIESIQVPPSGKNWYTLKGEDADGVRRVQATSYPISGLTMAGYDFPLFAGRTDAFCRPPGALTTAQGNHPPAGMIWGQYLWVLGASSMSAITTDSYDLVGWGPSVQTSSNDFATVTCTTTPCAFQSLATYETFDSNNYLTGEFALGVGTNWANAIDLYEGTIVDVKLPADLPSWEDIAGGRTLRTISGASFIVGATRSSSESTAVLEVSTSNTLVPLGLNTKRQNAAATYIEGQGLVVIGGISADDSTSSGIELLAPDGTKFSSLPYPTDHVQGAALVAGNSTGNVVWRIGGRNGDGTPASSVSYDLSCAQDCTPQPLTGMDVDVITAVGFGYADKRIVVGEVDSDGTMDAWRLTDTTVTRIPQREPRRSATAFELPNGFIALVGGTLVSDGSDALNIELVAY
jgi:hypothetical protein